MSVRDIAIASTMCLVGLAISVVSGSAWSIVVSSVCVLLVHAIIAGNYTGLNDRLVARIQRAYLDYRLGDRR